MLHLYVYSARMTLYIPMNACVCFFTCVGVFSNTVCIYVCVVNVSVCPYLTDWMCVSWFEMSAFSSRPQWFLLCSAPEEEHGANLSPLCRWSDMQVDPQNKTGRQTASCCAPTS